MNDLSSGRGGDDLLKRLEQKGLVASRLGDSTPERGGRAKRFFKIKPSGLKALRDTVHLAQQLARPCDGLPAIRVRGGEQRLAAALGGALHPLGGEEATGGHKGYGLALAVDLLTGVLAGASFGPNIVGLFSTDARSDLGQTFIVIDPAAVDAPGVFETRLEGYLEQLVAAPTVPDAAGAPFPIAIIPSPRGHRPAWLDRR